MGRYPRGYRDDEEMYVYDQCCDNCALNGTNICPMDFDEDEKNMCKKRAHEKKVREDAIRRDGELQWCIHWQQHYRQGQRHR